MRTFPDQPASDSEGQRFGVLLRRFRLANELSQERLAEAARISAEAVSALERGTRKAPQRQTLKLLIDALDLTADERELLTVAAVRPSQPRQGTLAGDRPGPALLSNVPASLTSFVGRDADVAELLGLMDSARFITIVGPGGVGKSRIAIETARSATSRFPDGVSFVALAQMAPHTPVLQTLAAALGIRDEGTTALEDRVCSAVGSRRVLALLDNCEHVLEELAPVVQLLLARCPGLTILATSRERLRVDGERIYRLHPLALGDAVDIFVDRASAAGFDPANSDDDLSIAAEICDRLDRMPLAIELAASCSDVLAFKAILSRLRTQFALPKTGSRSALPRHYTLDAVVEWSHDRLAPNDAIVFRRLAPFIGGCRLDDAQVILAEGAISGDDVLYTLFRLHEQSLVEADRAEQPRFQMLQTIRDFAAKQFAGDPSHAEVLQRFATRYFDVASSAEPRLRSARQTGAIARIAAEMPNLRAAFLLVTGDGELARHALSALGALAHYWLRTGFMSEGAEIFQAMGLSRFGDSPELASALAGAAFIELNRQSYDAAHAYAARAREVARSVRNDWLEVYAAIAEHQTAEASRAHPVSERFEEIEARALSIGDPWLVCAAALRAGSLRSAHDPHAALAAYEVALEHGEETGDAWMVGIIQLHLARELITIDPKKAASFVAAAWQNTAPTQQLGQAVCVQRLVEIAVALDRPGDAAFLLGIALQKLGNVGSAVRVQSRLAAIADAIGASDGVLVEAGRRASPPEADERIRSFIASVTA